MWGLGLGEGRPWGDGFLMTLTLRFKGGVCVCVWGVWIGGGEEGLSPIAI